MGTGARQLKAMLRKNWLLKIRHPYVTCAEILLPTVVMLMLIAVRTRVDTQIHPSQPYIRKDMLVEVGKGTSPNFQQVLQLLLKKEEILAFVPDTKATRSMINMMSIIFPLLQRVSRIYKDEEELEAYIRSDLYGTCNQIMNCPNPKIKGAVVFHNQGPQLFDYSIRLNHTWAFSGFPDVKSIMDTNGPYFNDLELGVNTVPTMQYSFSGFLTLQQVLDSFLIFAAQHTKNITLSSLQAPWTQYGPSNIRIVPFPTREYTDDEFQSIIKSVMGVLYLLGFLYPISRLISYSVFEKEQKIREGLYMMGLKDGVFHLSWFIAYALQFAVSSLIITVCTMDNLFKYSDKSVVFIYFFFFGVSAIMLSFLISTFFERAKTAVAVGTLAFLSAFFPYYSVNDEAVPMILKVIASLLSPTAFALGSVNFADYERAHVGLRWSNIWRASSGVNFSVCLLMMLLDALLYCVIGLYLDKVLPRENGVRYPWNFIFQKWFWKTPDINKYHKSSLGVHIRDKVSENAIFSGKENTKAAVEAINFDMRQQELDHRCIQIRNLHKVYASKKGKCCAVNSLQLTMYENQILALLGHNGAGKSTTISMLVGLLRPTSGDAVVFGKNIITDMEEIRKELGVCPQHDILFPELTVKEHLEIFAILKGVQEDFVNSVVVDMVDQSAPTASMAADIVYRHIPSATCVSEVGTEISFKLPLASSSSFESMFREIESCMRSSKLNVGTSSVEKDYIGIESYGISVTTLEEVFLRVAGCDYDEAARFDQKEGLLCPESQTSHDPTQKQIFHSKKSFAYYKEILGVLFTMVGRVCGLIFATVFSCFNFLGVQCCGCCIISRSTFWRHSKALFIKRAISARRDRKTIVFQLVIPAVFLLFGLLLLKLKPHPDQQSVTFTTSHFNPLLRGGGGGGPIPFDLSWPIAQKVAEHIEGGWIQTFKPSGYKFPNSEKALHDAIEAAGETLGPVLLSMSEFLMSSFNESYQSRYGAVVMDDQNDDGSLGYTVLHNSSCQHAAPTYINLMNTAILRLASRDKNMTIQTRNHPLPMTQSQHLQRHDLDAFSAAVIVSIAFSFIPASFAVPIVKEREVKAKHQQLISGVSILSYWTSAYIWDFISFLFPSSFAIILFYIFGLDQFIGKGCLLSTIVMFLAYGLAIASSTYCLTFFFSDHTMAQNVVLLVHFFTGLILMVISFIMGLIKTTASANSFLKNFFRLSPGFCFADGLASLALLRQDMKNKSSNKAFDWNVTGGSICYLGIESICYFLLALGLEILPFNKLTPTTLKEWWKSRKSIDPDTSSYREPLLTSSAESVTVDLDEDTDVKTERSRVLSGAIDNAIIYLCNLRKVYPGGQPHATKVAVHSLTFSVQEGECFGFLGTNGAGKTTTLSMLTGEEYPTDGSAYIFGKDICSKPKAARQYIGFCPQFDALLEYLTVQEHLELYATIKGVPDFKINEVVMEKLMEFDLLKHASKPSFSLSGGNKRKLSVAIAMIGDPPIVILDEPSTGMDPIAKRFMWEVISRLSTRRGKTAVILTTHSMNEAQALCTRIGIMVGGQLMCIGSPQHLKTRFGNHLELEVKPIEVSSMDLDKLCRVIQERLSHVPSHPRSLLDGLEVCIGATDSIVAENASVAEISLSREMIIMIGRWLGNEERIKPLICPTPLSDGVLGEQLFEQLDRDGGIPLLIFSEWWLSSEKFSAIDSFVLSSFPGAMFQGMNGLSVKYQLPCGPDLSLADVFGHLERKRNRLGIAEYSISQSTLETIFNHFAASP
ncbi:ABC transporter A family member 1 isoform X2 [Argentina anserina]|uniref:ABC transporter A family member 1 isoform X2 n=1 Tax=Argentina anserina TaxID=57926 RepID=UPI0021764DEB|nr:ABC transporter A family member 1 isoform X2 [Potentilla anserina]